MTLTKGPLKANLAPASTEELVMSVKLEGNNVALGIAKDVFQGSLRYLSFFESGSHYTALANLEPPMICLSLPSSAVI